MLRAVTWVVGILHLVLDKWRVLDLWASDEP